MQIRNVYYSTPPSRVMVTSHGGKAMVEMPVNVTSIETEDGEQYHAEVVYYVKTSDTPNLQQRVLDNYDAWVEKAKEIEPQMASMEDLVMAINELTDLVLGGM